MAETAKKTALVSEELASKFKTEKETPYTRWVKAEGLEIIPSFYVRNLRTVALKPWARRGGNAIFLNHDASRTSNDCYVMEIPPGKSLDSPPPIIRRDDSGARAAAARRRCGVTPARESHSNGRKARCLPSRSIAIISILTARAGEPARYVAVTNAPPVINLYEDLDFIFNTKYDFNDRFAGEPDYFSAKGEQKGFLLTTNFVPDAVNIPLITATERGAGGGHIRFNMAKGSMNSHISQFPIGTYKKGHAHGPGAHVIVLSGEGYSLMWPEGEEPQRYEWEVGTLIVPPNMWFHQHFNTGDDAGALSRLQARGRRYPQRARRAEGLDQPPRRRRPDRLHRREAGNPPHLRGRARQTRHRVAHGHRLCQGNGGARH